VRNKGKIVAVLVLRVAPETKEGTQVLRIFDRTVLRTFSMRGDLWLPPQL
jgi:hypothetical protein